MKTTVPRHDEKTRNGFVLLIVLVMIVIAAMVTSSTASHSLSLASEAIRAERELQHRTAINSIQQMISQRAADILSETAETDSRPRSQFNIRIPLAGQRYDIDIADENVKISLDALRKQADMETVRLAMSKFGVRSRSASAINPDQPIQSWSQLLPEGSRNVNSVKQASRSLTLWSDGRLNVLIADPDSVRFLIENVATQQVANNILERLEQQENPNLKSLLAGIGERHRQRLAEVLTTQSASYCTWIKPIGNAFPTQVHLLQQSQLQSNHRRIVW